MLPEEFVELADEIARLLLDDEHEPALARQVADLRIYGRHCDDIDCGSMYTSATGMSDVDTEDLKLNSRTWITITFTNYTKSIVEIEVLGNTAFRRELHQLFPLPGRND